MSENIFKTKDSFTVSGNVNAKKSESSTSSTDTFHGPWEFFKDVIGLVTRPLNQQICIPSTAFTPDFSLPTKAILVNIIKAKDTLTTINNKIKQISNSFDKDHSDVLKQKEIVKINIVRSYKKYKQGEN